MPRPHSRYSNNQLANKKAGLSKLSISKHRLAEVGYGLDLLPDEALDKVFQQTKHEKYSELKEEIKAEMEGESRAELEANLEELRRVPERELDVLLVEKATARLFEDKESVMEATSLDVVLSGPNGEYLLGDHEVPPGVRLEEEAFIAARDAVAEAHAQLDQKTQEAGPDHWAGWLAEVFYGNELLYKDHARDLLLKGRECGEASFFSAKWENNNGRVLPHPAITKILPGRNVGERTQGKKNKRARL